MDKYDPDFFIEFFGAIPEELWTKGVRTLYVHGVERKCALGFLEAAYSTRGPAAAEALEKILDTITPHNTIFHHIGFRFANIATINDTGVDGKRDKGAKENMLQALSLAKEAAKGRIS